MILKRAGLGPRVRPQQRIAGFALEIEVRQRQWLVGFDFQRQPQAQHCDVGGEGIDVHAVEIVADNAQLEVVKTAAILDQLFADEQAVDGDEFVQKTEQIRAGAACGIDRFQGIERFEDLPTMRLGQAGDSRLIDKSSDGVRTGFGLAREIAFDCFPAHEGDNGARRVVRTGLMPAGDKLLKDLAEHFGIDSDFDVERRRFLDGEVIAVEKSLVADQPTQSSVGDFLHALVERGRLEEAAVEEGDFAVGIAAPLPDGRGSDVVGPLPDGRDAYIGAATVRERGGCQSLKKQRQKPAPVKGLPGDPGRSSRGRR